MSNKSQKLKELWNKIRLDKVSAGLIPLWLVLLICVGDVLIRINVNNYYFDSVFRKFTDILASFTLALAPIILLIGIIAAFKKNSNKRLNTFCIIAVIRIPFIDYLYIITYKTMMKLKNELK